MFALSLIALHIIEAAQEKQITIEDIYQGAFRTERLEALRSMGNGKQYTVLNIDHVNQIASLEQYYFMTLEKVGTILSSAASYVPYFSSYSFSKDEKRILRATEVGPIFRRCILKIYYVSDDNSPFNFSELLKGKYLLIHGSGDNNMHVQNTMCRIEALVQTNKQFDWGIYPDKNQGICGGKT